MLVVNLIDRESIRRIERNSKTERKRSLPVLPVMEKTRRQKVQANSQSIMIIWEKIQEIDVSFRLTVTATFRTLPRLDFKGRSWKLKLPPNHVTKEMTGRFSETSETAGGVLVLT